MTRKQAVFVRWTSWFVAVCLILGTCPGDLHALAPKHRRIHPSALARSGQRIHADAAAASRLTRSYGGRLSKKQLLTRCEQLAQMTLDNRLFPEIVFLDEFWLMDSSERNAFLLEYTKREHPAFFWRDTLKKRLAEHPAETLSGRALAALLRQPDPAVAGDFRSLGGPESIVTWFNRLYYGAYGILAFDNVTPDGIPQSFPNEPVVLGGLAKEIYRRLPVTKDQAPYVVHLWGFGGLLKGPLGLAAELERLDAEHGTTRADSLRLVASDVEEKMVAGAQAAAWKDPLLMAWTRRGILSWAVVDAANPGRNIPERSADMILSINLYDSFPQRIVVKNGRWYDEIKLRPVITRDEIRGVRGGHVPPEQFIQMLLDKDPFRLSEIDPRSFRCVQFEQIMEPVDPAADPSLGPLAGALDSVDYAVIPLGEGISESLRKSFPLLKPGGEIRTVDLVFTTQEEMRRGAFGRSLGGLYGPLSALVLKRLAKETGMECRVDPVVRWLEECSGEKMINLLGLENMDSTEFDRVFPVALLKNYSAVKSVAKTIQRQRGYNESGRRTFLKRLKKFLPGAYRIKELAVSGEADYLRDLQAAIRCEVRGLSFFEAACEGVGWIRGPKGRARFLKAAAELGFNAALYDHLLKVRDFLNRKSMVYMVTLADKSPPPALTGEGAHGPPARIHFIGRNAFFPPGVLALGSAMKAKGMPVPRFSYYDEDRDHPFLLWRRERLKEAYQEIPLYRTVQEIKASGTNAIGLSVTVLDLPFIAELVRTLRQDLPDCILVVGGPAAKDAFEALWKIMPDIVLSGAAEETLPRLLSVIGERKRHEINFDDLKTRDEFFKIPNIALCSPEKEQFWLGPKSPMTVTDWAKYPVAIEMFRQMGPKAIKEVVTARGCPFGCTFCDGLHGKTIYAMRPEAIIDLMKQVKGLHIYEDNFPANGVYADGSGERYKGRDRAMLFCRLYESSGLLARRGKLRSISANIATLYHNGKVDIDLLRSMAKVFKSVFIGTDAFADTELGRSRLNKGYHWNKVEPVVAALEEVGLKHRHGLILTNVDTTPLDLAIALLNIGLFTDRYPNFSHELNPMLIPYQGTKALADIRRRGLEGQLLWNEEGFSSLYRRDMRMISGVIPLDPVVRAFILEGGEYRFWDNKWGAILKSGFGESLDEFAFRKAGLDFDALLPKLLEKHYVIEEEIVNLASGKKLDQEFKGWFGQYGKKDFEKIEAILGRYRGSRLDISRVKQAFKRRHLDFNALWPKLVEKGYVIKGYFVDLEFDNVLDAEFGGWFKQYGEEGMKCIEAILRKFQETSSLHRPFMTLIELLKRQLANPASLTPDQKELYGVVHDSLSTSATAEEALRRLTEYSGRVGVTVTTGRKSLEENELIDFAA